MRRAAKIDANQPSVVKAFRRMGCTVECLHTQGKGFPDLLVGISGINALVEVKDGSLVPSERRLTADQEQWHEEWRGQKPHIVESENDAVKLVNYVRRELVVDKIK